MQLWTHHPEELRIDDSNLVIDPSLGTYWIDTLEDIRYKEMLPLFQELVGEKQFLWCCVERGKYPQDFTGTLVEWELNIPDNSKIKFFKTQLWESILRRKSDVWSDLIVEGIPADLVGLSAVVLLPLEKTWIKCHGLIDNNKLALGSSMRIT